MTNKLIVLVFLQSLFIMHPICSTIYSILYLNHCLNQTNINLPPPITPNDWSYDNLIPVTPLDETQAVQNKFTVEYQWQFINYSWPSQIAYRSVLKKLLYIPENVVITSAKYYDGSLYVTMPQFRKGVPVTLGFIKENLENKFNPLIEAYPNWQMYFHRSCTSLQSVESIEIDENGIMWVLDGVRINNNTKCPPKLVRYNLKTNKMVQSYTFPNEVCLTVGGFLNDIVIENGEFAYITDSSLVDPGLIIYSLQQNHAWKLRDRTMFGDLDSSEFIVNRLQFSQLSPISGIALSPKSSNERQLFFSALADLNLYSIDLRILKDESSIKSGEWRKNVKLIGKKQSQSDGLIMDTLGNLYYGLLPLYSVGVWNMKESFSKAKIFDRDRGKMNWIDGFSIDDGGNLRVLTNNRHRFLDLHYNLQLNSEVKFRILKSTIGSKCYLY